ncbi:LysR family transcriptional regulator [Staphylococcus saprophyticus]|uniref:LysR family transcriptional regulator n=1 Tax=Staphylococcus xylosus TaxID=1288 RepID=UPI0003487531|nr:LysR family transcriptional regulator [Staphylococcus xylosus]MBF0813721.1 LysR family transcriptional regulator [Staphylococcus saprophyticus]TFV23670.1 LysR family transcriptional regulator [Staphylococcus saprophyticus]
MNIKQLKILKTLINTGSYTKTASLLNYTQSNISQQINQLEVELQNELFIYSNKQLVQTEFLSQILPLVNDYISTHDQILNFSKNESNNRKLKIAAPESLVTTGLSDLIKNFLEKYPETDIDLYNNTCSYNQTLLTNGEVDIAFVVNKEIQNKYINKHVLCSEEIVIVAHREAPDSLEGLLKNKRYNHFVINEKDSTYRKMFEEFASENKLEIAKKTELWSIDTIKTFLLDNMGFSVLPLRTVKDEIRRNNLKIIGDYSDLPLFYSFALTKKKNWENALINLFLQETKEFILKTKEHN